MQSVSSSNQDNVNEDENADRRRNVRIYMINLIFLYNLDLFNFTATIL